MIRVALLFLITAAFVVLVLSNLSPIALTFLGTKTLALPLGVWVVGAIGAGALTIALLSGLFRLSRPAASSASAYRPSSSPRSADRFTANPARTPWAGRFNRQDSKSTGSGAKPGFTGMGMGASQPPASESAAWDDWEDAPNLTDRQSTSQSPIRDTEDDEWADWDGFEEGNRRQPNQRGNQWSEDDDRRDRSTPLGAPIPLRTDFEVKRDPETRHQSGSVYSYSYRRSDEEQPQPPPSTAKPGEVYDADYRVITPPYHPDPEEVVSPPDRYTPDRSTEIRDSEASNSIDDDFDLDFNLDNFYSDKDYDRGSDQNSGRSTENSTDKDDDDEDWGLDDEPPTQGDRPRRWPI